MSFRAVAIVLRAPIRPPSLKLTAVVLADALNEKTGQLNPSLQTIADAVGIDRRQAQRYVQQLVGMGLLSVRANARGGAPGTTPSYLLKLDRIRTLDEIGPSRRAQTGDTDATPTGGSGVTPSRSKTGDVSDVDGCHGGRGRVTPKTQTGGAGVTQTWNEPRTEPRTEPGVEPGQQQTLDIAAPADAVLPTKAVKASKAMDKKPSKTEATWKAYAEAYLARYGVEPVRNARVNGMLSQLVGRLGVDESPEVARFYVAHPGAFYATRTHHVTCLLADAETLRTEWATGRYAPERGQRMQPSSQPSVKSLVTGAGRLLGFGIAGQIVGEAVEIPHAAG